MLLIFATFAFAQTFIAIEMRAEFVAPLNLDEVAEGSVIWLDTDKLNNQWQARNHGAAIFERHPDCWAVVVGEAAKPCSETIVSENLNGT